MKITNLIVPLVALSTINNNQVVATQAGREVNNPYSYESLTNLGEYGTPVNNFDCSYIIQKLAECWQMPNPFAASICSAGWAVAFKAAGCV